MNIVFDFGAVLFTWRPDEIVRAMFPQQAATTEAARKLAGELFHHSDWQDFDRGTIGQDAVVERSARRLGLPQPAVQALIEAIPRHLTPIQDSVDLLLRLCARRDGRRDIRLYYLSNMPAPFARYLEQQHVFLQRFDGGLFSADVQSIKPQPEIFRLLESRYALMPQRTVFIDDLPANVEAARARGWHAIHFESATQLEPLLASHIA